MAVGLPIIEAAIQLNGAVERIGVEIAALFYLIEETGLAVEQLGLSCSAVARA